MKKNALIILSFFASVRLFSSVSIENMADDSIKIFKIEKKDGIEQDIPFGSILPKTTYKWDDGIFKKGDTLKISGVEDAYTIKELPLSLYVADSLGNKAHGKIVKNSDAWPKGPWQGKCHSWGWSNKSLTAVCSVDGMSGIAVTDEYLGSNYCIDVVKHRHNFRYTIKFVPSLDC